MESPDPDFESRQDAQLRDVPLPEGLLERLRRVALADDEGLDAAIREVALPPGFLGRLQQAILTDDRLDAALREVPIPAELPARLQRIPRQLIGRRRLTRWATAAAVLLTTGAAYLGAMYGLLRTTCSGYIGVVHRPELTSFLVPGRAGDSVAQDPTTSLAIDIAEETSDRSVLASMPEPGSDVDLVRYEKPGPGPLAPVQSLFHPSPSPALLEPTDYAWNPDLLTTHRIFDALPELEKVSGPIPRGIDPPLVPGFDWPFYLRYGVFPVVSPADHPRLRSCTVPLGIDTASYELTQRYMEDERFPAPQDVRTEEFLAAMDYGFPPPQERALELVTAVGPSPFRGEGVLLLQAGVQARLLPDQRHRPIHLVLAIDVSASMRWGGRLEMIRRALGAVAGHLGAEDRVSVVTFSEEGRVLVENLEGGEMDQLRQAARLLAPEGSTNLGMGLRTAYALARRRAAIDPTPLRVVLLTDGLTELGSGAADLIGQRLAESAGQGIALEVVDLRPERESDPQLAGFARAGGGRVHRATNANQIRLALLEIVTETPQLVAQEARLRVTFNPKAVLAYRLLGHEGKSMVGLMPAHPEADLRAGESASALFEIRLAPKAADEVATAELTWREPGRDSQGRQTLTRRVSLSQFAPSFVQSSLSLQQAALVAETAELLRESPFATMPRTSRSRALARVVELANQADTRLYERPSFVEFVETVKRAVRAGPSRGGVDR